MKPVFLDTNVLVYAYDTRDEVKYRRIDTFLRPLLSRDGVVISSQVLQEFCNVFLGKLAMTPADLVEIIDSLLGGLVAHTPSTPYYKRAILLRHRYHLSFYDALIIQAALDLGCETLYSEDLQDGQKFGKLTIKNPFKVV